MSPSVFNDQAIGQPISSGVCEESNGRVFNPDEFDIGKQKGIRYGKDTRHRGRLITWVMVIIPCWLVAVLLITAFSDNVDNNVKVALLVTTTANVIGLALVVLRGMFEKKSE